MELLEIRLHRGDDFVSKSKLSVRDGEFINDSLEKIRLRARSLATTENCRIITLTVCTLKASERVLPFPLLFTSGGTNTINLASI